MRVSKEWETHIGADVEIVRERRRSQPLFESTAGGGEEHLLLHLNEAAKVRCGDAEMTER